MSKFVTTTVLIKKNRKNANEYLTQTNSILSLHICPTYGRMICIEHTFDLCVPRWALKYDI